MKKSILVLLPLLLLSINAFSQKKIKNTKTEQHQAILGSPYFIIPPENFVEATNFQGFQEESTGATILLLELPMPYSAATKDFEEEKLAEQGIFLKKKKEVIVNGEEGLFLILEQPRYGINFKKYSLVFGDDTRTIFVSGSFPNDETKIDKPIRKSILTIVQ